MSLLLPTKPTEPQPGFGRIYIPKEKDLLYAAPHAIAAGLLEPVPFSGEDVMYWAMAAVWNQGQTSQCVGYGCNLLTRIYPTPLWVPDQSPPPAAIYMWAQLNDDWEGAEPLYYGTSVRAGLDYLVKTGFIRSYHRLLTTQQMVEWNIDRGPIIVGTDWYQWMADADKMSGIMRPVWSQSALGGHCYVIYGTNRRRGTYSIQNSHGTTFGRAGRAIMPIEAMEKLQFERWGDAYGVVK